MGSPATWMRFVPVLVLYLLVCVLAQPGGAPVRDEPALLAAAHRLIEHGDLAGTGSDPDQRAFLWHGPGLVVLLAPFVALDIPLEATRFSSPVLLFAAVVLFYRLLRTRLAPRSALLSTYVLALYAPFVTVLGTIQKEPLAALLVVWTMFACTRGLQCGGPPALIGAGLGLAALAMVRLEYGWVILALLAAALVWWLVTRGRTPVARRCVAVAAIATLACVPWLRYTHGLTGESLYWGSSSGLSLFWMSPTLPRETGQWHSPVRVYRDPDLAPYRALFRRLDHVHPLESDRELRRRAWANIRADAIRYARNVAANAARLLVHAPTRPSQPPAALVMYGMSNGLLVAAVLYAVGPLWRPRHLLPPETAPFLVFAVLGIVVHLPPSASPRMLMPLVPVLLWFVAQSTHITHARIPGQSQMPRHGEGASRVTHEMRASRHPW